jgi:MFS transporter, ACS family, glucarate transporter
MKVRYFVLGMLVLLSVITYLDRICIGVAGTAIQEDLDISKEEWGWVLGAFLLSYGIFEIPTGAWGDKFGQRRILTRIVLWWSAFTALTPLARNYYLLIATRFLFGAGEAGAYPNASGSISRWFPLVERARAQGLVWGASRLGGALTPLLVIPLLENVGWQACFWIFGILGVVWAGVWAWWYRDTPAEHPAVAVEELAEIGPPAAATGHQNIPWGALFTSGQFWLIVAMYWFYVFGFIFFMFWLPEFLTVGRGMSKQTMGIVVASMFTMGAIGNVVGGVASDFLTKRFGLAWGRKLIGASCLAISGCLLFAVALTPGPYAVATLIVLSFGICDAMLPCSWAICIDVGRQYSGAVSGAMNSAGQAAGFLCTVLYGYLIKAYGYDLPLMFLAPSMIVSAVIFLMIDPTRPIVAAPVVSENFAKEPVCV